MRLRSRFSTVSQEAAMTTGNDPTRNVSCDHECIIIVSRLTCELHITRPKMHLEKFPACVYTRMWAKWYITTQHAEEKHMTFLQHMQAPHVKNIVWCNLTTKHSICYSTSEPTPKMMGTAPLSVWSTRTNLTLISTESAPCDSVWCQCCRRCRTSPQHEHVLRCNQGVQTPEWGLLCLTLGHPWSWADRLSPHHRLL